jgi:hypothetical protein
MIMLAAHVPDWDPAHFSPIVSTLSKVEVSAKKKLHSLKSICEALGSLIWTVILSYLNELSRTPGA